MLAEVARVLAEHQISIASVIQHEALEDARGRRVPLVIMTHTAPTGDSAPPSQDRPAAVRLRRGGVLLGGGLRIEIGPGGVA